MSEPNGGNALSRYVAERLGGLAACGTTPRVLDFGCGKGTVLEALLRAGHDVYGCDFSYRLPVLQRRLGHRCCEERVRLHDNERSIPFASDSFDAVYALQVFEHVKYLDAILGECARVLRPNGVLIATLPLATTPIEAHLKTPIAHWLPAGAVRVRYLRVWHALGWLPRLSGWSAEDEDRYLSTECFYRFENELLAVAGNHFEAHRNITAEIVDVKLGMLNRLAALLLRALPRRILTAGVTYLVNAAFEFTRPRRGF